MSNVPQDLPAPSAAPAHPLAPGQTGPWQLAEAACQSVLRRVHRQLSLAPAGLCLSATRDGDGFGVSSGRASVCAEGSGVLSAWSWMGRGRCRHCPGSTTCSPGMPGGIGGPLSCAWSRMAPRALPDPAEPHTCGPKPGLLLCCRCHRTLPRHLQLQDRRWSWGGSCPGFWGWLGWREVEGLFLGHAGPSLVLGQRLGRVASGHGAAGRLGDFRVRWGT